MAPAVAGAGTPLFGVFKHLASPKVWLPRLRGFRG